MNKRNKILEGVRTWSAPDSVAIAWIFLACSNSAGNGMSSIGKEN